MGLPFFRDESDGLSGEKGTEGKSSVACRFAIMTAFVVTIANTNVYAEIWFWYSGAGAYSIPFSVLLVALTLFLLINKENTGGKRKTGGAVCTGFLLFLSSGGSLAVVGAGCYAAFLLMVLFFLITRKISVHNLAVLVAGAGL